MTNPDNIQGEIMFDGIDVGYKFSSFGLEITYGELVCWRTWQYESGGCHDLHDYADWAEETEEVLAACWEDLGLRLTKELCPQD